MSIHQKIYVFILAIFCCGINNAVATDTTEGALIKKYQIWKQFVEKPEDTEKIFHFFYENPGWPMFFEITKKAETKIDPKADNSMFLRFSKIHQPRTPKGTIAYCKILLKTNRDFALKYINQIWRYQNLSVKFAKQFKRIFKNEITEISDAIRLKRLIKNDNKRQLEAMMTLIPDYMVKTVAARIKMPQKADSLDPDDRYNRALSLSNAKKYKQAAEVLIASNEGEVLSPINFFNLRRAVSCNLARAGHPLLAYRVISMHSLNKLHPKERKNYVKAEWLSGFIAFRFLDNQRNAIKHFQNAYENSKDSLHKSKNAFWLAEVYMSLNNTILAIDFFSEACKFFSTFYGLIAAKRLMNISTSRFLSMFPESVHIDVSAQVEQNFNDRELVKVLKILAKYNLEKDIKFLAPFYKELVDEIDDPTEESLLMTIATTKAEMECVTKLEATKQKYSSDKTKFKLLSPHDLSYVKKINSDECFLSLVHAIIKRESMFNPKAKSHAGARGLMQIMPATADFEMKKIKFYTGGNVSLFDVEKNLTVGSFLLNRLLKKYKNNIVYVMYAYNAGEGNLNKFLKSIKNLHGLTFLDEVELIPIKETRIYIKHGLYNIILYSDIFERENCYNCKMVGQIIL